MICVWPLLNDPDQFIDLYPAQLMYLDIKDGSTWNQDMLKADLRAVSMKRESTVLANSHSRPV